MKKDDYVVAGIDPGAYSSAIAVLDANGVAWPVKLSNGEYSERSAVLFGPDGTIVGQEAINTALLYPDALVCHMKPGVGQKDAEGNDLIRMVDGDGNRYTNADGQAKVMRHLIEDANSQMIAPITHVVITCPAAYTNEQRKILLALEDQIGCKIVGLVAEPEAAAHAYIRNRKTKVNGKVIIFDLGCSTLDITIVDITDGVPRILGTDGHPDLGGRRLDLALSEIIAAAGKKVGIDIDNISDPAAKHELAQKITLAKHTLSKADKALLYANIEGKILRCEITRTEYEAACAPILDGAKAVLRRVLDSGKLNPGEIKAVIPVGPSCYAPMIQRMINDILPGVPIRFEVDVTTGVAQGAVLVAAKYVQADGHNAMSQANTPVRSLPELASLRSVSTHALGCEYLVNGDRDRPAFAVIIPEQCPLPTSKTEKFGLIHEAQTQVQLKIMQGKKGALVDQCILIKSLDLVDIPAGIEDQQRLVVTYSTDRSGVVHVEFTDTVSGKTETTDVNHNMWSK